MQTAAMTRSTGLTTPSSGARPTFNSRSRMSPACNKSPALVVRASQSQKPAAEKTNFAQANITNSGTTERPDSYQRIEEPVRSKDIADQGPPVSQRQNDVDRMLVDVDAPEEQSFLGTTVAFPDAMRFKGAAPEVVNSRLAMLGFVMAMVAEFSTGKNLFQQVQEQPWTIAGIFLLFSVASLVPILRGVPRKGAGLFQPDAEIINGRVAMLGFVAIIVTEWLSGGQTIPQFYGLFH